MRRIVFFTLVVAPLTARVSSGGEKDWPTPLASKEGIHLVLAKGTGTSHADALKSALSSAIEQVVATMVRRETITDPGQSKVIKSEILTASVGLVEGYKEKSSVEKGGVWHVQILARVSDKKMKTQLERSKIPINRTGVDGEGLFAEAVSERLARQNTIQWLTPMLADYPWNCVKAKVVEYKELAERGTKTTMTIGFKVETTIDMAQYQKTVESLVETLDFLSVKPSSPYSKTATENHVGYVPNGYFSEADRLFPKIDKTRYFYLCVDTAVKNAGFDVRFPKCRKVEITGRTFVLHQTGGLFLKTIPFYSLELHIRLLDRDGKLVRQERFPCAGNWPLVATGSAYPIDGGLTAGDVMGLVTFRPSLSDSGYQPLTTDTVHAVTPLRIELPIDDTRRVKHIEAFVTKHAKH